MLRVSFVNELDSVTWWPQDGSRIGAGIHKDQGMMIRGLELSLVLCRGKGLEVDLISGQ